MHYLIAMGTCVENIPGAVLKALAASTPKSRLRDDPRPPIPAGIWDEIRLKNRPRRQWQITRDPGLIAEVNRLHRSVTRQFKEWRNDQWSATFESLDPDVHSLWMTKRMMRILRLTVVISGRIDLAESEKAEAPADSLETQFQPMTVPLVPAVIQVVYVALRSYYLTATSKHKLISPDEVQETIKSITVGKTPGLNGITNRALNHLLQRVVSPLAQIYNAVLRSHHFPTVWKHARDLHP
jgi:hypothetical protein